MQSHTDGFDTPNVHNAVDHMFTQYYIQSDLRVRRMTTNTFVYIAPCTCISLSILGCSCTTCTMCNAVTQFQSQFIQHLTFSLAFQFVDRRIQKNKQCGVEV